ncbi:MAG TPA: peroxiredoxin [Nitrososphaerales archaeon]|nr:peroxiredoxin [Nitrososphaerales archaeon]
MLPVGAVAPEFSLESQSGVALRLSEFKGKKNVVLYFYPKDFTTGCTIEANAFRESFKSFDGVEAVILGVSADTVESHRRFSDHCQLPYTILSDTKKDVRKLYDVSGAFGLSGRVTYVIDKEGVIRGAFSSQLHPKRHVAEALATLARIDEKS